MLFIHARSPRIELDMKQILDKMVFMHDCQASLPLLSVPHASDWALIFVSITIDPAVCTQQLCATFCNGWAPGLGMHVIGP